MRFRTKIIITYSILILLLAIVFGIVYRRYTVNQYEKSEYENLQVMAEKTSQQFDEMIKTMVFIPEYLLSDMLVLDAMRTLNVVQPENELTSNYITDAQDTIRLKLNSYYIMKNFYRVLLYNSTGSVVSSNNYSHTRRNPEIDMQSLTWIEQASGRAGTPVIIGTHIDEWGLTYTPEIFSLVKEIQGMPASYIEVQKEISDLKGIFSIGQEDVYVMAIQDNGQFLYSDIDLDENQKEHYKSITGNLLDSSNTQELEMIVGVHSNYSEVTVLLIKDRAVMNETVASLSLMAALAAICIIIISFTYILIVSNLLTKPIKQLRLQMERTDLDSLKEKMTFDKSYDEMEALNKSYQSVLLRLNEAVKVEKEVSLLQVQAQFDALQAQVNPHFLYNVLNVLSNRGVISGDEQICDICTGLATMLRYSTGTKKREVTVSEEIEYLEEYFILLKLRYQHKLSYKIEIEDEVKAQIVPKVLLQQIVENAINHGFENTARPMEISIDGWQTNQSWVVRIKDNGQGFETDRLDGLKTKMENIRNLLKSENRNIELEIGGMGLVNSYARLLLMYGENLIFSINNEKDGAVVIIGAKMNTEEE